jgi:hypothetical chaperone protein
MRRSIGLDFGTTNSSIAVAHDSRSSETVLFRGGDSSSTDTYRSVLYFEPKSAAASGPLAIERYLAAEDKGRLIQSLKSFLASRLFTSTNVFGRQYTLEDLIAIMLRDLRGQAEEQLGRFDGPVIVGRPVRYSNANNEDDNGFALNRLKDALEKAGFGPVVFEYEPVAAAYFYESTLDHDELIIIGDFGGGTSDFSLLRVGPNARKDRTTTGGILGTEGVALAGDAFDGRIVRHLVSPALGRGSDYRSLEKILPMPVWVYSDLERWHYLSFLKSAGTLQMIRSIQTHSFEPEKITALLHIVENDLGFYMHQSVQMTKSALSSRPAAPFSFQHAGVQIGREIQRVQFEEWIETELNRIRDCVDRLLAHASIEASQVDRVFLTGGSSLVPAVRQIFEARFGREKISSGTEFTSVARGLALRGLQL